MMFRNKNWITIAALALGVTLACNALGGDTTDQPTEASVPPTVTLDASLTQAGPTSAAPEQATQMPVCTPPACAPGESILCQQPQGCPLGCGVVCGVPSPTATSGGATATVFTPPDAPAPNAEFEGISFHFDSSVMPQWTVEIVAAEPHGEPEAWLKPSHYAFTFAQYPVISTVQPPRILVFPVRNFQDYNSIGVAEIAKLQKVIAEKPTNFADNNPIPMLPIFNAGQMFRAGVTYMNFQNGSGIRFITQLAQNPNAVNNAELFYTYQGLTTDNQYLVTAFFPVSHGALPPDATNAGAIIGSDYLSYIAGIQATFDGASANDFTPRLLVLDLMIASLKVK